MTTNLSYAFREMRRRRILAKQNFMRSVEEAAPVIATEAANLVQQGVAVKGCCFYTATDDEMKVKGYDFFLCYHHLGANKVGHIDFATETVGRLIVRCLAKYAIDYLWNGNADARIMVKAQTIRKMSSQEARTCKLPAEAQYRMGDMERPYWIHYSAN